MGTKLLSAETYKEYLKNVKDLEVSCYQQRRILDRLNRQPGIVKNEIGKLEKDLLVKAPNKPGSVIGAAILLVVISAGISLIGALLGIIISILVSIIGEIVTGFTIPFFAYIKWGALIGYIIAFLLMIYWSRDTIKDTKKEQADYPNALEVYNQQQQRKQEMLETKKKQLADDIPREQANSLAMYEKTKKILKEYYDLDLIYPKYRGIVPICTIYEYFESGRCCSLTGYDGAYNLYENELRMNVIIGKLDDIINRLDEISSYQRVLAQEIKTSNLLLKNISQSLENIESDTTLTRYYSSVSAANTTFLSWLAVLDR